MKTMVMFRSSKFPPYEGEEEEMNPGLWGRRLAEYLVEKLTEKGIQANEIIPEDWGYYIPVEVEGVKLAVCCGHQGGEEDQFLCFTDPKQPIVRRWFRKVDLTAPLSRLVQALDEILRSDPEIRDIEWSEP